MKVALKGNNVVVTAPGFDLAATLDCGQCFRWSQNENGSISGVFRDKFLTVTQNGDDIIFYDTTLDDFNDIWCEYFDFNTDYKKIKKYLSFDDTLKTAITYTGGIHILKQDAWEVICSFIISQNNNIPRIKGIIGRLCENFGDKLCDGVYTFPSAEKIASLTVEDLSGLRAGFRAKYIIDAAKKISLREIDMPSLYTAPLDKAQKELQKITGIGPKVSACALLFGFYRINAFPVDVWIKKALNHFYKDGFPKKAEKYAGIAQQYIFHYIRTCDDESLNKLCK